MSIIEIQNLGVAYDKHFVLHDISFAISPNDYIGIIGPNGGGKTTLIRCILRLMKPTVGTIVYGSVRTPGSFPTIGYLPQYNRIDPKFPITVEETVLSGLGGRKPLISRYTAEEREMARRTLKRMELEGLEQRPIGALSGGQLQRTLLGRAIIAQPEVLILDEPGTYIDKRFETHFYPLLDEINRTCAIVLVSHDIGTLLRKAKTVVGINRTLYLPPAEGAAKEWAETVMTTQKDFIS